MLPRPNRITHGADFREVVRRGRRRGTPNAVYYRLDRAEPAPLRLGFIVSRAVGNAVARNRVRRRLRAIGREIVDGGGRGADVVIRALPASTAAGWDELRREMTTTLAPVIEGRQT